MKKIIFFLLLTACAAPKDYNYTKLSVCNASIPMIYTGKVELSVSFPHNGDYNQYETFIMTDSLAISIYGKYVLPEGCRTYVIFTDSSFNRRTARFYWDGERQTYEIVKN